MIFPIDIHKVYAASALSRPFCGQEMKFIAFLTEPHSIRKFLEHTGLSPPEEDPLPPAIPEVRLVPVDEEGRDAEPSDRGAPASHRRSWRTGKARSRKDRLDRLQPPAVVCSPTRWAGWYLANLGEKEPHAPYG